MGNKDLTKEYAKKAYYEKLNKEHVIWRDKVFNACDISKAFNAGRESVIGDIPDLEWDGNHDTQIANCVAGVYIITMSLLGGIVLTHNFTKFDKRYGSFASAKQAANEHFKQTLKQALKI